MINPKESALKPEVICVGEALVDRLGPIGSVDFLKDEAEDRLGGAPANVAIGLAKLGIKTAFCGRLGDDLIGKEFLNLFNDYRINIQGLQFDKTRPTRVVMVRRDQKGERFFEGFYGTYRDGFADEAFDLDELSDAWPLFTSKAKWLLVGTIPLASPKAESSLLWMINQALKTDIKIALDINWRPVFWNSNSSSDSGPLKYQLEKIIPLLEKVSLLKLAKEEASWFFNTLDPTQISECLPKKPDVIITNGANTLKWSISRIAGEMQPFSPSSVIDTTGAGDAFTAGLMHGILKTQSLQLTELQIKEIVSFAAGCGALTCMGAGAIDPQPSQEEDVLKFLSNSFGGCK